MSGFEEEPKIPYDLKSHIHNVTGLKMTRCGKNCTHNAGKPGPTQQEVMKTLIRNFWNKMTQEQREKFLDDSSIELVDKSKKWGELDEVQQYMIVKYFYIVIFGESV